MSFQELLAALSKFTPEQRRLLVQRVLDLDRKAPSVAGERVMEERNENYSNKSAAGSRLEEILSEVHQLPRGETVKLLDHLLVEIVAAPDPEIDAAWRQEIQRRVADIESGRETGIAGDEVLAELRQIVGR